MPWIFLILSFVLGAITGFAVFSKGRIYNRPLGQVAQGVLSCACFGMMVAAFWKYGWKIGLLDILVIFIGANVGLTRIESLMRRL